MAKIPRVRERTAAPAELEEDRRRYQQAKPSIFATLSDTGKFAGVPVGQLSPISPVMHPLYRDAIEPPARDPLPATVRARVAELLTRRNACPEAEVQAIDAEIVGITSWHVLRPDVIAADVIRAHSLPRTRLFTVDQAALVLAAIGEAGYPIAGNGAPDYREPGEFAPVAGPERDAVVWAAARYWAELASRRYTYVSLGDDRGFMPRQVQYDQPGSMNPSQQAALTFGPAVDDTNARDYMRRHTRMFIRVRETQP
jgi:hypothetical protein